MQTQLNHFNGPDYDPEFDDERLTGQLKRIVDLMKDGNIDLYYGLTGMLRYMREHYTEKQLEEMAEVKD